MGLYEYCGGEPMARNDAYGEQWHHVIPAAVVRRMLAPLLDSKVRDATVSTLCRHGDNKWTIWAPKHKGSHPAYSKAVEELIDEYLKARKGGGNLTEKELREIYERILHSTDSRILDAFESWGVDLATARRVPVRVLSSGPNRLGPGGTAAAAGALLYAANAALVLYIGSESYAAFADVCEPAKDCQECLAEEVHEGASMYPASIIAINGVRAKLRVIPKGGGEVVCVSTMDGRTVTARRDAVGGEIDLDCLDWKRCQ
jgi:hypothetical protein